MLNKKHAVVAERLRRLTRNQFPSGSAGSNPADCGHFFWSEENIKYFFNRATSTKPGSFLRPSVRMQRCVTAKKRIPARVQLESEHEP